MLRLRPSRNPSVFVPSVPTHSFRLSRAPMLSTAFFSPPLHCRQRQQPPQHSTAQHRDMRKGTYVRVALHVEPLAARPRLVPRRRDRPRRRPVPAPTALPPLHPRLPRAAVLMRRLVLLPHPVLVRPVPVRARERPDERWRRRCPRVRPREALEARERIPGLGPRCDHRCCLPRLLTGVVSVSATRETWS